MKVRFIDQAERIAAREPLLLRNESSMQVTSFKGMFFFRSSAASGTNPSTCLTIWYKKPDSFRTPLCGLDIYCSLYGAGPLVLQFKYFLTFFLSCVLSLDPPGYL